MVLTVGHHCRACDRLTRPLPLSREKWTAAGDGHRFCLLVHHTDADREWAYDRSLKVGHLNTALDEARKHGWTIADMKRDWDAVYTP